MTASQSHERMHGHVLGDQLRAARQRLNLSQEELAEQTGLSVRTVRNLETAQVQTPRLSSVRLLYAALKIPRDHGDQPPLPGLSAAATPHTTPADIADFVGWLSWLLEQTRRCLDMLAAGQSAVRTTITSAPEMRSSCRFTTPACDSPPDRCFSVRDPARTVGLPTAFPACFFGKVHGCLSKQNWLHIIEHDPTADNHRS